MLATDMGASPALHRVSGSTAGYRKGKRLSRKILPIFPSERIWTTSFWRSLAMQAKSAPIGCCSHLFLPFALSVPPASRLTRRPALFGAEAVRMRRSRFLLAIAASGPAGREDRTEPDNGVAPMRVSRGTTRTVPCRTPTLESAFRTLRMSVSAVSGSYPRASSRQIRTARAAASLRRLRVSNRGRFRAFRNSRQPDPASTRRASCFCRTGILARTGQALFPQDKLPLPGARRAARLPVVRA